MGGGTLRRVRLFILVALVVEVAVLYPSAGVLVTTASATPQERDLPWVDPQVWADLAAAPDHQTMFVVVMREGPQGGAESAISAQMALEKPLEAMQRVGSVSGFAPYYGANVILIRGTEGAVRFLAGWPEVAQVLAYQPGQPWEQPSSSDSEFEVTDLAATGQITGTVTGPGGVTPLSNIRVSAYRQTGPTSWLLQANSLTLTDGTYAVGGLPGGIYRAKFEDDGGTYVTEFYDDQPDFSSADNFNVTDGQTTSNIDASLALAGQIAGTVTQVEGGSPVPDIVVAAFRLDGTNAGSDVTGADGTYSIGGLPAGSYKVKFSDSYTVPRYLDEYYDNVESFGDADAVSVIAGVTTGGVDAALGQYGKIAGTVTGPDGITTVDGIYVDAWEYNDVSMNWDWVSGTSTDASGSYELSGLTTRDYRVEYSDPLDQFATEFYNNKPDIGSADDVHVELGLITSGIDASLVLKPVTETHQLVTGWNLISLPLSASDPDPAAALSSIDGDYNVVWAYDGCDTSDHWKIYDPPPPPGGNDLTAVDVSDGYWIDIISTPTLSLDGTHPMSTDIPLCADWNLFGYPSMASRPVEDVLAGIAGKYSLVWAFDAADSTDSWKKYNPSVPVSNDLEEMQAWFGYWIDMNQAATLTIPGRGVSSSSASGLSSPSSHSSDTGQVAAGHLSDNSLTGPPPTPFNPWGIVTKGGQSVPDGTLISGWCDGVKYGEAPTEMYEGQSWYSLEVLRDDPATAGLKEGCYDTEEVSFKVGSFDANETTPSKDGDERVDLTARIHLAHVPLVMSF
jgi:hypothetical protein